MLHLVLRLNGADDERKVACAVELLGRGVKWERANADNVLPSMVDEAAFKQAFFRELPRWREDQQQLRKQRQRFKATQASREADERARAEEAASEERKKRRWAQLLDQANAEKARERERDSYHLQL